MNAAGTYYTSVATAVGSSEATNRTTSVPGGEASILINSYEISSIASVGGQCYTQSGSAVNLDTAFTFAVSKGLYGDSLTRSVENVFRHSIGLANCFVNADIITATETVARTTSITSNRPVLTSQAPAGTATNSTGGITPSPTGVSTDDRTTFRSKDRTNTIKIAVSVTASVFSIIVIALVIFYVLKRRNLVRLSKQGSKADSKEESDQLPWLHQKPELDAEQQRHEMEAEKEPRELQGQSSRQEMEAEQEALELEGQSSRAEIGGDQANVNLRRTRDSQELGEVEPSHELIGNGERNETDYH